MASQLSSRRWLPLLVLLILSFAAAAAARSSPFDHAAAHENQTTPISPKVTLLGDASIENGSISLTCARHHCTGVGRALYSYPVRLREHGTNRAFSFSSNFTFSITPLDGNFGDGLAFLVTSDLSHHGSSHGNIGIFYHEQPNKTTGAHHNHTRLSGEKRQGSSGITTMAVEFDTSHNNGDINGNHVALDLGSISSVASADAEAAGVGLKSGNKMRAWVEYSGDGEELLVWLSYGKVRPPVPVLRTKVNLSGFLNDNMFIGFSASNGRGAARHIVEEWRFRTSPLVAAKSTQKRWLALGLGLGAGLAAVFILVVTSCIICRRRYLDGDDESQDLEKPQDQEKALDLEDNDRAVSMHDLHEP